MVLYRHFPRALLEGPSWEYIFWWQARGSLITPGPRPLPEGGDSFYLPILNWRGLPNTDDLTGSWKKSLISSGLGSTGMNKPLCLWEKLLCVHQNLSPLSPGPQLDYISRLSCSWVCTEFWQWNVGGNAISNFQTQTIKLLCDPPHSTPFIPICWLNGENSRGHGEGRAMCGRSLGSRTDMKIEAHLGDLIEK